MTREETVIRLVARVRPLEQWRTARELRRRIRDRLDRLDIDAARADRERHAAASAGRAAEHAPTEPSDLRPARRTASSTPRCSVGKA